MKILDSKFMKGFIKMADDGFQQGWHERNGGNLSYRLKAEEVEMIRPRLNAPGEWQPIGTEVPGWPRKQHRLQNILELTWNGFMMLV